MNIKDVSLSLARVAFLAGAALLCLAGRPAAGATFLVETTADLVDNNIGDHECLTSEGTCSLRAAVQEANAKPGLDEIRLPAGTFTLSRSGAGEDAGSTGDLDVTDDLTLVGAGRASTVIDGLGLDRVFDSHPPAAGLTLWLIEITVKNGQVSAANDGGCFRNPDDGRLLFDKVFITGCRTTRLGGAIYNRGSLEGFETTIAGNGDPERDSGRGGGIANVGPDAQTFLLYSELRDNQALSGGGLYTSAELNTTHTSQVRIEHSTLVGNSVLQNGGALMIDSRTRVFLEDSTVSGNTAGSGGGLFNDGGGFFFVRNSTITKNHATNIGGGIGEVHFDDDFIILRNSILAGNTADFLGPDCNFRITSEGGTILGNTDDCDMTFDFGDRLNVDPLLGPLLHLGPYAWAHLPLPGSPAIDAGTVALCSDEDQRRKSRPLDGDENGPAICDIGAIELDGDLFAAGFETGTVGEWSFAMP